MTRLLFITNAPTPYQLDFGHALNGLKDISYEIQCLSEKLNNLTWELSQPNWCHIRPTSSSAWACIKQRIKIYKPDIIILGGYKLPSAFRLLLTAKLKYQTPIFLFCELPNHSDFLKKQIKTAYIRLFLLGTAATLAVGKRAQCYYQSLTKQSVFNLPYSSYLSNFYQIQRTQNNTTRSFLFAGRLIERKNILNLCEAFSHTSHSHIRLNIIGAGELSNVILDYARKDHRIRYHGFTQPADMPQVFSNNDIFILPSREDGWGVVIAEAMAAGMPIISTNDTGAAHEFIEDGINGKITTHNIDALHEAINYYASCKEITQQGLLNRQIIQSSLADATNAANAFKTKILQHYKN